MSTKRLLPIFALILAALLPSIAYADVTPPPPNDFFADAKAITIGKNYTAGNIGAASNEAGEPTLGCFSDNVVPNSVWFTFTLPVDAQVYLSTDGTALYTDSSDSVDTVIAVFIGDSLGALTQVACSHGTSTPFGQVNFYASGATLSYYVVAGTAYNFDYDPSSVLALNTRVIYAPPIVQNDEFDDPLGSDNWKVKQPSGDAILCNSATYPSSDLNGCAFEFVGGPHEDSKLSQTVPFPSGLAPRKHGVVTLGCLMRGFDTVSLGSAKLTLTISYTDGTPPTKESVSAKGLGALGYYVGFKTFAYLASSKVDGFKAQVSFKSTSGVLMVDSCGMLYYATPSTRSPIALPPIAASPSL